MSIPLPLLQIRDLSIQFRGAPKLALDRVSFDVSSGEVAAIVGESGSGKTTLGRTIVRLLPAQAHTVSGAVNFSGTDLLRANGRQLRRVRGAQIGFISQDPATALHPMISVGRQISEVLRAHRRSPARAIRETVESAMNEIGLTASDVYDAYPHQLSAGQQQRIVIVQALISKPALLIADEPVSNLDSVLQQEFLQLLRQVRLRSQLTVLFITHDAALLRGFADRCVVLSQGRVVETGTLSQISSWPLHSYSKALWGAAFSIPRAPDHGSDEQPALVTIRQLSKTYVRRGGPFALLKFERAAVHDVSFSLRRGHTLALVGRSGSGKSTVAKCITQLTAASSGEIRFEGQDLSHPSSIAAVRSKIQIVLQHSSLSINPRLSAIEAVEEPLRIQERGAKSERRERAIAALREVGISPDSIDRSSAQFSGGQRQRIAIARALILDPVVLILDEPFTGLDVIAQKQIALLLTELQERRELAVLLISHDLRMCALLADELAVMSLGQIVEFGDMMQVLEHPQHAETRKLVAAAPGLPEWHVH